jgi:hypothetical protein
MKVLGTLLLLLIQEEEEGRTTKNGLNDENLVCHFGFTQSKTSEHDSATIIPRARQEFITVTVEDIKFLLSFNFKVSVREFTRKIYMSKYVYNA